jgi:hypothetical protein
MLGFTARLRAAHVAPVALVALTMGSVWGASACVGDIGDEDAAGACDVAPGRVGLQRLTRAEYNRTVRDLFGVTSSPADTFPPDSATEGFDNNAKSLTTSPQLAALLLDAAEQVAAEALANMRDAIITCDPADADACARATLTDLALRVYRRTPTTAEIDDLMLLMAFAEAEGDSFDDGIVYALSAMLMAPQFLYRGVPAAAPSASAGVVGLDDFALATRLSYFLWGSTPDDALLARAGEGSLRSSLRAEFDRMLADPKSAALYESFVTQWLQLGKLADATPDAAMFPGFSEELRQAMLDETRLFFEGVRTRDASALELINGTQTFANADLAGLYGVSGVTGSALVPVTTDPSRRAGILTMPAILTMTSGPTQPNIVRRGVWLAEAMLCAKPPPPPDGVPAEPVPVPGETERERLARHRQDPSCASCHDLIDPLGFAFENYDAIGAWRDEAEGVPVDNLGALPDGTAFNGVVELAGLLAEGEAYKSCVTRKFMTYALGRTMDSAEACVVANIGAEMVTPESRLSDLLFAVVTSDFFLDEEIAEGL